MAIAAVTFDGARVEAADVLGSIWTDLGGGKCSLEPDVTYQGVGGVSEKVGTTEGGISCDMLAGPATTVDYSTTRRVILFKHTATNSGAMNVKGATGGILEVGSGGIRANYARYYVAGSDTWPLLGGFIITAIDPNVTPSATPGTAPTLTAIDYYGWAADFSVASRAENVVLDAIDYIDHGTGLTCLDGIATTNGDFELFATEDEDTAAANRWGVVSTREGILYVTGVLTLGDSGTGVEFTSAGEVVVWPDAEFLGATGFFGLDISLENSATVISITSGTFISRGTSGGSVDTRAVVEFIGTTVTLDAEIAACNFQNLLDFICTSKVHIDGGAIETVNLTQAAAHIEGCTITTNALTSIACITDPTFGTSSGIHDTDFTFGSGGHAFELSGIGATVTLTNVNFSGYGADTTDSAAIDVTAVSGTTTINYSGGNAPTYKTAGATVVVQAAITVTYTGLQIGTEVRVYATAGGAEVAGVESTAGTTFAAGLQGAVSYTVVVFAKGYIHKRLEAQSYSATGNFPIDLQPDANYRNQ